MSSLIQTTTPPLHSTTGLGFHAFGLINDRPGKSSSGKIIQGLIQGYRDPPVLPASSLGLPCPALPVTLFVVLHPIPLSPFPKDRERERDERGDERVRESTVYEVQNRVEQALCLPALLACPSCRSAHATCTE